MAETIQSLDLGVFKKKQFAINGDENKILELDTSDMNVAVRLNEVYPKIEELYKELSEFKEDEDDLEKVATFLKDVDQRMRDYVDYIFDSNVCEMCVESGSMYDPIGGQLRYELLISIIAQLYEDNLSAEVKKIQKRIKKHTDKYTGKK